MAADFFPVGSHDEELLTEMAVFGDAGCFLDKVLHCGKCWPW